MPTLRIASRIAPFVLLAAACDNGNSGTGFIDPDGGVADSGKADAGGTDGAATDDAGEDNDAATSEDGAAPIGKDGPPGAGTNLFPHDVGDATAGRDVFRFETFGNENFWTDVAKLPAGVLAAGFTPVDALKAGLNVDVDALHSKIDDDTFAAIAAELATDLSPANAPILNNPATTLTLLNANSVIGLVVKDSNGDSMLDLANGDKVGVACAFCHSTTDKSVFSLPTGGSIGKVVDGPTPHTLNVGAAFALAANTRALYPLAQLKLDALNGETIGRAPKSAALTEDSTEEDIDAYFSNPDYYPVGMFDDQPDGTGAPMHITPMFRSDLSAPYGSEGTIAKLDNFSNLVYTALLDPRGITTDGGKAFLNKIGGAAGDEIVADYVKILAATGVSGDPQLTLAKTDGTPGDEATPIGVRVDNTKLLDLSAYMDSLAAPKGEAGDAAAIAHGRELFRESCTNCHNVDQSVFVPSALIPMATIFPGDDPVNLGERTPPLTPFLNTVDNIFDDKMVVVNASIRGDIRGIALPLLLDLARKPVFLHDNSVSSLSNLLDEARGAKAPHPFYLNGSDQADMIAFLKSLDTE